MISAKNISPKQFFFILAALTYIFFCFIYNPSKNISKFNSYEKAIDSLKNESKILLVNEFDFDSPRELYSLVHQKVAADTQVIKIEKNTEGLFLFARIQCNRDKRMLIKLELNKDKYKEYNSIKYHKVLCTFELDRIEELPAVIELYDLNNSLIGKEIYHDIILEGRLDEILYERPIDI